ncbi:hypothetical protein REPUB_Repub04eG0149600 [Reevesia pubescens]
MGQMKKFGFILLVLSVSMVVQLEGNGYEKPINCGHLECAPYKLIQSQSEFEIRSYSKAMWVATSPITSASYKDAVSKGFNINPPKSVEAHPVKLPQHKFAAVRRFGGFMDDSNISAQMSALKKSLKDTAWESSIPNKHSGDSQLYSAASYNSPFEYENRVNEVMLWFD